MRVLILSKTRMSDAKCCVGGISKEGEHIRLLTRTGENQPENTELVIGQIWEAEFTQHTTRPPHVEDVLIQSKVFVEHKSKSEIIEIIKKLTVTIWEGNPTNLFDGKIKWTNNGSGYINEGDIPAHSVGFWISDSNLMKNHYNNAIRYRQNYQEGWRSLKYVGLEDPVENIPAGTLLRVSLARWWSPNQTELRCYLQLSGWYNL